MHLTIPLISKPSQRASLFSLPPVTAALPAVTIALLKQLTESPSTRLLPLPTMSPSAARTSVTPIQAQTLPIGIPVIPRRSARLFLIFPRSHGMTTVAGGGGPSQCASGTPSTASVVSGSCQGWPKPSWQNVLGNPNDGVRDTPDISLFAADGLWSHFYVFCWSDAANGGAACGSDPSAWSGAGGTSFASPIMAGIQALINQKAGGPQGNPAPIYYQLASAEYGSSGS